MDTYFHLSYAIDFPFGNIWLLIKFNYLFVMTLSETITKGENMSNIAYLRVSHLESLNGTSLDTQEKRCKAFAELHGFKID